MMEARQRQKAKLGGWRFAMWTAIGALLALPLLAMAFTNEVRWDSADFAAAGLLLFGFGAVVELAFRFLSSTMARVCFFSLAAIGVVGIWADAAVGIF